MSDFREERNVIVGQSGGPTAVINASLAGVYKTAKEAGVNRIYGMRYGIEGLIHDKYLDLSMVIKNDMDLELLKRTPSSFLGSCRYKLPDPVQGDPVYMKIFSLLDNLHIRAFFYIGGNDSMDTIGKLADYGRMTGSDICFIGIPKTIDNDLAITDHTPGYGSVAKYLATITKEIIADTSVYDMKSIVVLEIMGRNSGWLTGSTALARGEDCPGVDLIYLPEVPFSMEEVKQSIEELFKKKQTVVIAISEGVTDEKGTLYYSELLSSTMGEDAFGHKILSGAGRHLTDYLSHELNCKVRLIELSTLQRCGAHIASKTDIDEAFQVGGAAIKAAFEGHTGCMIVLKRVSQEPYMCVCETADVNKIANIEKRVPRQWINKEGNYVTKDFVDYVRPLIQSELTPIMVNGLPGHFTLPENL